MHDLWPEVVAQTKTQNPLWASLVAMLIDLLTQATMRVIKSGDSMLKASVTIGFLVIEFFHAYASKYNIQRRKLSSEKRKRYQFSFSHP